MTLRERESSLSEFVRKTCYGLEKNPSSFETICIAEAVRNTAMRCKLPNDALDAPDRCRTVEGMH